MYVLSSFIYFYLPKKFRKNDIQIFQRFTYFFALF